MAAEYKLSYTATEIDEKLGKIDNLVATINGVSPDENGNVEIGEWRHIRTVTIPEDITTDMSGVSFAEAENGGVLFAFDTDKNGNFFELNEIIVGAENASTPNTSNDSLAITKRKTPGYSTDWVSIPGLVGKAGATKNGFAQITGLGDGHFIAYQTIRSGGGYSNVTSVAKTEYVGSSFKAICLQLSNGKGWGFSVGSKFKFWGR